MIKLTFDGELKGSDGTILPVHCEVQPAYVGGQKAQVKIAVPAQHITDASPESPCTVSGRCGSARIDLHGIHWRSFPTSARSKLGLESIEILHIERLTINRASRGDAREVRFHIAPISYLRSKSGWVSFGDDSSFKELFSLDLPDLGPTSFVVEWATIYHRDSDDLGATVVVGFSAVGRLPPDRKVDPDHLAARFRSSLEVLSVLFRQAVSLHGWTFSDGETVSVWIDPLAPNEAPSAREDRGDFVARPQVFVETAAALAEAYAKADEQTQSLVRHLSLAVNPYNPLRTSDHFLFMFSALERIVESAYRRDCSPRSPAASNAALIALLERLQKSVLSAGGEHASVIVERVQGLMSVVDRPSYRDKFEAFFRVYPSLPSGDLWPILGSEKERGLRDIRNALAHGRGSFVPVDVVTVAEWHLSILLERVVFVLLDIPLPEGIAPGSFLLRRGGRGWYEREWWATLRSKPDRKI